MAELIVKKEDIIYNYRLLAEKAGVPVIPVLKANGYGLGAEALLELLKAEGVSLAAVSRLDEALPLCGKGVELLVLSCYSTAEYADIVLEKGLTAAVGDAAFAALLSDKAEAAGKKVRVHIKLDTGMGRFGFLPAQLDEIAGVFALPGLEIAGIFSHCSAAFLSDGSAERQLECFGGVIRALEERGLSIPLRHIANSSAFMKEGFGLDAVRIGSALTGRMPARTDLPLRRVGQLQAEVIAVRKLAAGSNLGYGGVCRLKKDTEVAVVALGTADGFAPGERHDLYRMRDIFRYLYHDFRLLMKKPAVYGRLGQCSVRMLGRPSTAHSFFDVSGVPCAPGDRLELDFPPLRVGGNVERIYE